MAKVDPIPKGYHTVTPSIIVKDGAAALDFYKRALGAQELGRMSMPDGKIAHAEFKVGDSTIMLADEMGMGGASPQTLNGVTSSFYVYVQDADAAFKRAVDAGASVVAPMEDAFWGDRYGMVRDPFGHLWSFATRQREVSDEEMKEAMAKM
ncbi:MAG: VOC family protein [Myxococcales bacterium]